MTDEITQKGPDKYLTLFNNMDQGFCIIEVIFDEADKAIDYRFLETNPVFEKQTGLQNVVGKNMLELQPAHEQHWFDTYGNVVRTQQWIHFENVAASLTPLGMEPGVWYDVYAFPFGPADQNQVAVLFSNITQRKKAEFALQESEEIFRSYITASFDVVYKMSADWQIMYSLEGKDFLADTNHPNGSWLEKYIPEHEQQQVQNAIEAAIRDKKVYALEHQIIDANGNIGWTLSRAVPRLNERGELVEWMGTATNITERRKAEQAVRLTEQRLQRVLETDAVGMLFFNYEGTVIQANHVFLNMTGYTQAQIDRRELTWRTMTPPEWVAESEAQMEKFARTGRVGPYEKEYFLADGSRSWMLFAGRDIGDGTIAEYCIDINDRKRIEEALRESEEKLKQFNLSLENKVAERTRELELSQEELQKSNQQLQDSIAQLESFNYIASHDLQEPLRKIEMFAALLAEHDLNNERLKGYLSGIRNSSARMRKLIDDLLAYARLDRSNTFESTDLNKILEHVKADYEMRIKEKNAVIKSDVLPALHVIPFQMYQLFSNLIGNSLKFAERRPEITITCQTVTSIPIRTALAAPAHDPYVEITFADNGIGFDPEYSERIFQVFQRLHAQSKYPGTGIGLSIVERVVKNHDGFIQAKGEKGEGAVFTVYLPVRRTEKEG